MGTTTNYGYNVPVGSDNVNLLPQMAVNFPMIDSDLKAVSNAAIGSATELKTGTVHALTRADTSRNVFVFVATSDFEAGETFEVDGVQVTGKTPDGQNLSTGAYVINSGVLCVLNGTLLTIIVSPTKALDSDKLDGHDSAYFATDEDLDTLGIQVGAISDKVGTGTLDVGTNCVGAINTINALLNASRLLSVVYNESVEGNETKYFSPTLLPTGVYIVIGSQGGLFESALYVLDRRGYGSYLLPIAIGQSQPVTISKTQDTSAGGVLGTLGLKNDIAAICRWQILKLYP